MKTTTLFVLAGLALAGCGLSNSAYTYRGPEAGKVVGATVGQPLIKTERGTKNDVYDTVMSRFQKQFIYSGKAGNVIRFSYREFSGVGTYNMYGPVTSADSYARPAFTQDVQYDLTDGPDIAFQEMQLKVLDATSAHIRCEVVKELEP
jgi:hypothetical protein